MLYQWRNFGNPWLFSLEQFTIWARYPAFPWVGIFDATRGIFVPGPFFWQDNINDLLFTLIPLITFIVGWRLLPLDYSLSALSMMIFVLCEPYRKEPLLEIPRYLLVVFPVFIIFALWSKSSRRAKYLILSLSLLFFIENVIQFALYGWVL